MKAAGRMPDASPELAGHRSAQGSVFPSRLPFEPGGAVPRSARRRRRARCDFLAEQWVNHAWCLFSFWELGCPRGPDQIAAAVCRATRAPRSETYDRYVGNLLEDALAFARLDVDPSSSGRRGDQVP